MTKPFTYEQAWAIHQYGEAMAELGVATHRSLANGSEAERQAAYDEAHKWWLAIQDAFESRWPTVNEQLEGTGYEH